MTCLDRVTADDASRKRKLSTSASFDQDFIAFLQGAFDGPCAGEPAPAVPDAAGSMMDAVASYASQLAATAVAAAPADMNDLVPGALCADQAGLQQNDGSAAMSLEPSTTHTSGQLRGAPSHRAVTTGMPLPRTSSAAAAAAAAAGAEDDDDTVSAATLPMPHKRRRAGDDDEVNSSPNDLVEVPSAAAAAGSRPAGAAPRRAVPAAAARDRGAAAAANNNNTAPPSSSTQSADTGAAAGAPAAAAAAGVPKSILVAKVLTKSDATSKRIILPRIAVEFNLPQLANATATAFHLTATDPTGTAWPLVIKAWANGQNPKPVYVLEQVGEMLKQHKLTIGDAVALLAARDGSAFFLDWNTDDARAAAARPTLSGVFSSGSAKQQQQQDKLAEKKRSHGSSSKAAGGGSQQQQQHKAAQAAAAAAARPPVPPPAPQQQQSPRPAQTPAQQLRPAAQTQQQQGRTPPAKQQLPPLMTAVPVNATPFVPGTFIPTSPCQLLVMGDGGATPYFTLEEPGPRPGPSSMLVSRSDAAMELPEADVLLMATARGEGTAGLQCGSYLLCPRTPGCSRPAGHQGWCLGHKGYKKRRV